MTGYHPDLQNLSLDSHQRAFMDLFIKIADSLNKNLSNTAMSISSVLSGFIKTTKNKTPCGIYLYGDVGRGKTMLMSKFYDQILVKKELVHFQHFMHDLHQNLHKFQLTNQDTDKIIQKLAKLIADRAKVLCIDEFEIKDIADAMLIMKLFSRLSSNGVFIFLTTNTKPDNLYKDGLQRNSFLPFVETIKKDFTVLDLKGDKDYRLTKALNVKNRIIFPINNETKQIIENFKNQLCEKEQLHPGSFKVFEREVVFAKTHENILFTNFEELFNRDLGYSDYVNLCQRFKIILVENVKQISENETDVIIRIVNFIDNVYFYKVILFASLETEPSLLYPAGKRLQEFQRTISRLYEMNH